MRSPSCRRSREVDRDDECIGRAAFCGVEAAPACEGVEVSAPDLAREIRDGAEVLLLDVREPQEWDICHLEGAMLLPLGTLPATLGALDGRAKIVTYCHKGVRSLKALEILKSAGVSNVRSLRGGVDAWSRAIDPSVPRY